MTLDGEARSAVGSEESSDTQQPDGAAKVPAETMAAVPGPTGGRPGMRRVSTWLGGSRLGLVAMALVVGAGAGLGAVAFRWLIYSFTWLATGYQQFGAAGPRRKPHMLAGLGSGSCSSSRWSGGLLYGPLIHRFAREARGHGVPEVMLAVAENGGRIRPPVTIVKALASAICIGAGGSVGREGPIVQIGSAFASTLGQLVRMSETPAADHRGLRSCWRDRGDLQRADHRAVLRLRDRPARVLARRDVRDDPRRGHRRLGQPGVLRLGPVLHRDAPWAGRRQRLQLPVDRAAGPGCRADRGGVQDLPVPARGRGRRLVEGPARMGAPGRRRARTRRAAACAPADVRGRLSGHGQASWPATSCSGSS